MKLRKQLKNKPRKASIRSAILVGLCIFFVMYSNKFNTFYHPLPSSETESGIKILYANIHKNNTDYTGIKETIKTANPDMILFVEFSENHYNHLKDFLQKDYPYINSTTRSQKFIGSMVFSKYKIENRADDFPQGRRRYAYFSIKPGDQKYYIYLVHTSSPDSYEHFIMRNNQLITFTQDFQIHAQKHRQENDKVIVIGDFNVSPRSLFYQNFQAGIGTGFTDVSSQIPLLFTRRLNPFPLFWAHIDHLRTNTPKQAYDLTKIDIPGSDHKGFIFTIPK